MKIQPHVVTFWSLVLGVGLYCYIGSRYNDPDYHKVAVAPKPAVSDTEDDVQTRLRKIITNGVTEYCSWQTTQTYPDCLHRQDSALMQVHSFVTQMPNQKLAAMRLLDCWMQYKVSGYEYAVDFALVNQCMKDK